MPMADPVMTISHNGGLQFLKGVCCAEPDPGSTFSLQPLNLVPAIGDSLAHGTFLLLHSHSRSLAVRHGEEGRAKFREEVRKVFGLQDDEDILLTFGCKVPGTGTHLCKQSVTLLPPAMIL